FGNSEERGEQSLWHGACTYDCHCRRELQEREECEERSLSHGTSGVSDSSAGNP
ncbi:hypothetical protein Ancab_013159, partial [Ancistrocladus abbreviatus]